MSPPPIPVTVTFTLPPGTKQPTWNVNPDPVPVPHGAQAIVWNLQGTPGAVFAKNGIVPGNPAWPGANPKALSATQWGSPDTNTGGPGTFKYTINVVLNGQTFTNDPQIENQPMGGSGKGAPGPGGRPGRDSGGPQKK